MHQPDTQLLKISGGRAGSADTDPHEGLRGVDATLHVRPRITQRRRAHRQHLRIARVDVVRIGRSTDLSERPRDDELGHVRRAAPELREIRYDLSMQYRVRRHLRLDRREHLRHHESENRGNKRASDGPDQLLTLRPLGDEKIPHHCHRGRRTFPDTQRPFQRGRATPLQITHARPVHDPLPRKSPPRSHTVGNATDAEARTRRCQIKHYRSPGIDGDDQHTRRGEPVGDIPTSLSSPPDRPERISENLYAPVEDHSSPDRAAPGSRSL